MPDKTRYNPIRKQMAFLQHYISEAKFVILAFFMLVVIAGCFEPDANKPLKSTYWSLIELNGEDSSNVSSQPEVHLIFHTNDNTFHGSDGCNRVNGSYTREEEAFRFESIISTRMHCEEGMDQANTFLQALSKTKQIRIKESHLILYAADIELARFEAKDEY